MAQNWGACVKSEYSAAFGIYNALAWPAVPVFVMISGSLFLSRNIPVKKLYFKYIFRVAAAFVFWSGVYAVRSYLKEGSLFSAWELFVIGNYHLWFLPMIIGLYMIVPFMKRIADSEVLTKYFLVLSLIFAFVLPQASGAIMHFSERLGMLAERFINNFFMFFVMGYSGYFLLGCVLDRSNISPVLERCIYAAGFIGLCISSVLPSGRISVNMLCESAAVFVFFRKHFSRSVKAVRLLARYSFGAYLVHVAVLNAAVRYLPFLKVNPVWGIPFTAAVVFIISMAISAVLNALPILNKYIA